MADAQASGACYGNIVWVQVPSPASWQTSKTKDLVVGTPCGFKSHLPQLREQKCSLFFARKQFAMHGQDENRALKACFQASWSQIGRIRRMPRQSQAAKRRRDLSA